MKRLQVFTLIMTLLGIVGALAAPPIEYNAAVRGRDGYLTANMPVKFMLEIVDRPSGGAVLYSETQALTTDSSGMVQMMVGEGTPISGDYDSIDWSQPRYLASSVDIDGSGYRSMGTMQLLGAPIARQSHVTDKLVRTNPAGEVMELTVNDMGELRWIVQGNTGQPNYDQSKVPDELYFIGTFNNWKVEEAVEMTKLSDTKFTIDRHLMPGEVFKFVPMRKWGTLDWSGTAIKIGEPVPLQEFQNTPAFSAAAGDYTITIDFYRFTMLITRK